LLTASANFTVWPEPLKQMMDTVEIA
jgi:hypothetical protein